MWAESLKDEKEPAWQKAYLDYMFRLFDASGDKLTPSGSLFNAIDYDTFVNLWKQYFHSTDTNDVGNSLLGTV
ncbi:hypothetical protein COOONC_18937 [Cooperia oncophora]